MHKDETTIRAANPNLEEGRLFANFLDRSAEGFISFWLGRNAVDIVATAFVQTNHDLSYQNVTFAERNRKIVGMILGYTAEQHRLSSDRPLKMAAGRFNLRMVIISRLFAPLLRVIDTMADSDFYLHAIAVDKGFDGKGLGSVLLDSIEERAIACGSARLALDVSAKNERAKSLYEHRGMVIESRWPKRLPIPGLRFYRMIKTL